MPVFVIYDNRALTLHDSHIIFYKVIRLLGDTFVKLLAVTVVLVNIFALLIGIMQISAYEEIHSLHSALHSSGSIKTRTNLEDYVTDGYILVRQLT